MPPKKLMVCAVRGCPRGSATADIDSTMCHRFPLEVEEAAEWVRFSKNGYADHQFKLAGPIGVRKLFMCSLHFEPSCYKTLGNKAIIKSGALPTLNEACDMPDASEASDEPPQVASNETKAGGVSNVPLIQGSSAPGTGAEQDSRKRSNHRRASDRFFDFLMDDDDDDDDDLDLDLRQVAKITKLDKPAPVKRQPPKKHDQFCLCNGCRKERAAKAMEKGITPNKATQTEERGLQPLASPVPIGANQDSCRLCFSTDQLEPLCSGMIVVRDEMLDKIYLCTGILIIPRPRQSIFVCTPCAQLINSFHSYRQQVCSNNRALMQLTTRMKPEASPAVKARKTAPPVTPLTRKVPVTPILRKVPAPVPHVTQYRPIAPKTQLHMVQTEIPIVLPDQIKTEPDPLEGCGEPARLTANKPTGRTIKMPAPKIVLEVKDEPLPETGLLMEAEEGREELPEEQSWKCWQCENAFAFQFECAKHMLQVHGENVAYIKQRMNLDELNANMLEMMSVHNRK